jgi:folate-binding protein YgfZ
MALTDTSASSPRTATPLAELVASSLPPPELGIYRGALTPQQFDAQTRETEALASGAAVHDLGWMRRVAVRGEDCFRWLSGMVTNTVIDLAPGAGAWNLVLNAQGRIQGDLWVWRDGESLELEIAADQQERLLAHLNRFIIMDDVELELIECETAIGLAGPHATHVVARLGLPALEEPLTQVATEWNGHKLRLRRSYGALAPHFELWMAPDALQPLWQTLRENGAVTVGTAALDAFRIAEGIPAYGIDIAERDLPQETAQTRALSFNKGCYLGQEIVERIRSRGNVHRHLRPLELTGPLPPNGAELMPADAAGEAAKPAGHITSAAELHLSTGVRTFALGMIRAEAEIGDPSLTYAAGTATGKARILAAPPILNPERIGSREP